MNRPLFVYGVLTLAEVRQALHLRIREVSAARLPGFRRQTLLGEGGCAVPGAVRCPGESLGGLLLLGVDRRSLQILDRFEEVERGLYHRRAVLVYSATGICAAQSYLPARRSRGARRGCWSALQFRRLYLKRYLNEVVRPFMRRL